VFTIYVSSLQMGIGLLGCVLCDPNTYHPHKSPGPRDSAAQTADRELQSAGPPILLTSVNTPTEWKSRGLSGQCHAPAALPPRKRPGTHCIGRWMDPRVEEVYLYSFFNVGARRGGWSMSLPGRFTTKKDTRYPLYCRLDGPQGQFGRMRKISLPPGFDPQTV